MATRVEGIVAEVLHYTNAPVTSVRVEGIVAEVLHYTNVPAAAEASEWPGMSTLSHGHRITGTQHRWSGGSLLWGGGHRDRQHDRNH